MAKDPSPEVQAHLPGWKSQFGEVLYLPYGSGVHQVEFVFRTIGLDHYEKLELAHHLQDPEFTDDTLGEILQDCLLWPVGFDLENLPQADFIALNEKLKSKSPFGDVEAMADTIERYRERYTTPVTLMCAFVQAAFPGLTLDLIKKFTSHQLFQHLIIAEQILQREFPIGHDKKEAPEPPTPDQVKAMRHQGALERREAAIGRARANRAKRQEAWTNPDGAPPPVPGAPTGPPAAAPAAARQQYTDNSELAQEMPGGPRRREFTNREILKKNDAPIDFAGEADAMGDIWNEPDRG